ncbi:hypothetical protein [Streptomyces caniferus]|uniref:aromatic-ring hydroxylase C-terminal domain-containing protein n=1 Tax=Streptomyces caniferus TaxID=285557 RepID=UPI003F519F88
MDSTTHARASRGARHRPPGIGRPVSGIRPPGACRQPSAPGDADPLVGRRMPDLALAVAGSAAIRVYELLPHGRFVLLDLAGDEEMRRSVQAGWGKRVTPHTVTAHDSRADLDGVREILVRPDGHIAWATRTTDVRARRIERFRALTGWAGLPAGG